VQKMAVISHYCLQSYDLCVFGLLELIRRGCLPDSHHLTYLEEAILSGEELGSGFIN